MKLGIFTDPHYTTKEKLYKNRRGDAALERIRAGLEHFTASGCDMAICLGDLIDKDINREKIKENLQKISELLAEFDLPFISLMGNHDGFEFEKDEFYRILGEECLPKNIYGEKSLIFLDTCYFKSGEHYMPGDSDWTDCYLPEAQKLKSALEQASGDIYLFMHHNLDPSIPSDHRLYNDGEVREIIEGSGKVKAVYQGHYHIGSTNTVAGIEYRAFPALCEEENAFFIIEI